MKKKRKRQTHTCTKCGHGYEHHIDGVCRYGDGTTSTRGVRVCGCTARKGKTTMTKKRRTILDVNGHAVRAELVKMRDALTALIDLITPTLPELLAPSRELGAGGVSPATVARLQASGQREAPVLVAESGEPLRRTYDDGSSHVLVPTFGAGPRALLTAIVQYDGKIDADGLRVVTGYRGTSIRTFLGELTGLFERDDGRFRATLAGIAVAGAVPPKKKPQELIDDWCDRLGEGPRALLSLVAAAGTIAKSRLEDESGYKATSVRTFVGELAGNRLVRSQDGMVRLSRWLGGAS